MAAALPPFDLTYDLKLHWHRRFDNEPRSIWLREQLAAVFKDHHWLPAAGRPGAVSRVVVHEVGAGLATGREDHHEASESHILVSRSAAMSLVVDRACGRARKAGVVARPVGGGRGAAPALPPLMQTPPKPAIANAKPVRSCESLATVALPNTTIESAAVDPNNPGVCRVTAITTHPPMGDKVRIWVAIPTSNWNGRFLGNGGGGFVGGNAAGVNQPVALGFAAGATDTGHEGGSGSFALDANGRLNWQAIRNFAHVGIHEMTVTGKALTQAMYGVAPRYSYFNGCSTGGRQGLMEAQRYPQDYNGIARSCAGHQLEPSFHDAARSGARCVMNAAANPVAACKLAAATAAAIAACDAHRWREGRRHRRSEALHLRPESAGRNVGRRLRRRSPRPTPTSSASCGKARARGRHLPLVRAAAWRRPECAVDQPRHAASPVAVRHRRWTGSGIS